MHRKLLSFQSPPFRSGLSVQIETPVVFTITLFKYRKPFFFFSMFVHENLLQIETSLQLSSFLFSWGSVDFSDEIMLLSEKFRARQPDPRDGKLWPSACGPVSCLWVTHYSQHPDSRVSVYTAATTPSIPPLKIKNEVLQETKTTQSARKVT